MTNRVRSTLLGLLVYGLTACLNAALAQDPVIDRPAAGNTLVFGTADPAAVPITVYDISYDTPTAIGSGHSIDTAGNFAVSVNPPLVDGNTIIAEDDQGRQSAPALVEPIVNPAAGQ